MNFQKECLVGIDCYSKNMRNNHIGVVVLRIISVSELNSYIKNNLENDSKLANIWVKGEISNFKRAFSGHLYFTLKDNNSLIKTVMFRSRALRLLFNPENGMSIIVRGYISVYERDGAYQLYAEEMEPDGIGALYVAFEQLKQKLEHEGLFDKRHKKNLPMLPGRVAIVTSPVGAAIRDITGIIQRRWPGMEMVLVPAAVQGNDAPAEIARGIELLNRLGGIDVIIVGRGGGSIEELWAFNTELVARSIFASDVPVISAVGHETDFTIADLVADVRAATPSAAAEIVVPDKIEMQRYLESLGARLYYAVQDDISLNRSKLERFMKSRVMQQPVAVICETRGQAVDRITERLNKAIKELIARDRNRLALLAGQVQALSPLATLSRGYSICTEHGSKEIISDIRQIEIGEKLDVQLKNGKLLCEVRKKM